MNIQQQRKKRAVKILLGVIFAAIGAVALTAVYQGRGWNVPEEARQRKNPLAASGEGRRAAAAIYRDKCANCHGERGRGDGAEGRMHWPAPRDFTDAARMNVLSDGELFYKMSRGRRPMPSFDGRLGEEQRWQLVLYIRGFAGDSRGMPAPVK
jgi:mono/diheme cytochrome c family protein